MILFRAVSDRTGFVMPVASITSASSLRYAPAWPVVIVTATRPTTTMIETATSAATLRFQERWLILPASDSDEGMSNGREPAASTILENMSSVASTVRRLNATVLVFPSAKRTMIILSTAVVPAKT